MRVNLYPLSSSWCCHYSTNYDQLELVNIILLLYVFKVKFLLVFENLFIYGFDNFGLVYMGLNYQKKNTKNKLCFM